MVKKCYNLMEQTKCILAHVKQKKLQPMPPSAVGVTDAAIGISFNVHKTGVTRTWSKDKTHNWISAGNRCLILPSTSSIVWSFFVCVCSYCKMIVREVFLLVQTVCCLTLFILCWTDSNFRMKICNIKGEVLVSCHNQEILYNSFFLSLTNSMKIDSIRWHESKFFIAPVRIWLKILTTDKQTSRWISFFYSMATCVFE